MFNEDTQEDVTLENDIEEVVEETEESEEEETVYTPTEREKELEAENKKLKAILDRNKKPKAQEKQTTKSDDFGYDVKAYLKSSGIAASEFEFVRTELKQSGLGDVDSLLENEYFQSRLEKHRAIQKTKDATPTGRRSGGVATDSVEYWLGKPFDEVPSEMKLKVVDAKMKKDKSRGMFYNS